MGANVQRALDKSKWTDGARRREAVFAGWKEAAKRRKAWEATPEGIAYQKALADHPLRSAWDHISEEELQTSRDHAGFLFKSWASKNGHREALAMRKPVHPQATLERAIRRDLSWMVPRGLGDREKSVKSAAQRAKQEVRRLCKVMGVNALWTLTYRENVQDRDLVLKHLDSFRRRVAKVIPKWAYIAVLEHQERGAFHIHLATHALPVHLLRNGVRVKSWNVMRAIWRDVVGDLGGNFDESKRKHWWKPGAKHTRSAGSIASYIAGYVAKDMLEGELNRKRFSHSAGVEMPECYKAQFAADETTMGELLTLSFSALGDRVTRSWFDPVRGVFFAESDDSVIDGS